MRFANPQAFVKTGCSREKNRIYCFYRMFRMTSVEDIFQTCTGHVKWVVPRCGTVSRTAEGVADMAEDFTAGENKK